MKIKHILFAIGAALLLIGVSTASGPSNHSPVNAMGLGAHGTANPQDHYQEYWSEFIYLFVAGSPFTPRGSTTTWGYGGTGCVYAESGSLLFNLDLQLPEGARIDYLRMFYKDTAATDSTGWITVYDQFGDFTDLVNVASAGDSGYGTSLSPLLGHVVSNAEQSYVLLWRPGTTGNTMQLCGFRVAYRVLYNNLVFIPLVNR